MVIICRNCHREHSLGWGFALLMLLLVPLVLVVFALLCRLLVGELQIGTSWRLLAAGLGSLLIGGFCCEGLLCLATRLRRCPQCGRRQWLTCRRG